MIILRLNIKAKHTITEIANMYTYEDLINELMENGVEILTLDNEDFAIIGNEFPVLVSSITDIDEFLNY